MANKFAICFVGALLFASVSAQWRPTAADFQKWMDEDPNTVLTGDESFPELRAKVIQRLYDFATSFLHDAEDVSGLMSWVGDSFSAVRSSSPLKELLQREVDKHGDSAAQQRRAQEKASLGFSPFGPEKLPFFRCLPLFEASLVPDAGPSNWSAPCFQNSRAEAVTNDNGDIDITLTLENPSSLLCTDRYLLATTSGLTLKSFFTHGTHKVTWSVGSDVAESERYDLTHRGVRVFRFVDDSVQTVVDLLDTVNLFLEALTHKIPSGTAAERNLYFMANYPQFPMAPRPTQNVDIPESEIQSGDFFGIVRLDGLDPMLAWAMGSTTGHTTVALRFPESEGGVLHVCESTAKTSYWPVNGIQCTPYAQWLPLARAAGFNVVHAPLSPANRARFNASAALERFRQLNGTDYGYHNLLWGWLDTVQDNYPCVPPHYDMCLTFDHLSVLFGLLDRAVPSVTKLLVNPAWNHRLGTTGLNTAQLLQAGSEAGLPWGVLPTIVEQDAWDYNISRWGKPTMGKSMVCCVFVCNMWKAGGLFDDIGEELNCAELTNSNDYQLNLFDTNYTRPQQCVDADPDNQLCQLAGGYSLHLNDYNSLPSYPHMDQECPSQAPSYPHPSGC